MVGSRKLSNEEVEALLGGLEADKKKPSAATFDPNEVREFKFKPFITIYNKYIRMKNK